MSLKEVTLILGVVNARHGPDANLDEAWPSKARHDHLADPASLIGYLDHEGLAHPKGRPSVRDLQELRDLADAGRVVARQDPAQFRKRLASILARYSYRLEVDGTLSATASGWRGFAGDAARGLVELVGDRDRLRFCANPACEWLFLDESRNHSRQWCSMESCGSRAKMARYRRRRRAPGSPDVGRPSSPRQTSANTLAGNPSMPTTGGTITDSLTR
jgi:predicted RNA-binding Zn ribbon-like protein